MTILDGLSFIICSFILIFKVNMDDAIIIPFLWVNKWSIRELSNFPKVTE